MVELIDPEIRDSDLKKGQVKLYERSLTVEGDLDLNTNFINMNSASNS